MSNELIRPASFAPTTFADAMAFCKMLSQTSFVPRDFKGKPDEIFAAVQFGAELGVGPMQALQNIAVINGKPSVYGDLALALVHASGHLDYIIETDDGNKATCELKRRGDKTAHIVSFSNDDAKRAGLFGKAGPWQQYPARMRMFRARGFALRDKFPDVLKGLMTREEAMDYPYADEAGAGVEKPPAVAASSPAPSGALEAINLLMIDEPKPTDKASPEQRKALVRMAREVLGDKDAGDAWLRKRVDELGIKKPGDMAVLEFQQLTQELIEIKAQGDAIVTSFEATRVSQEPDIEF